MIGHGYFLSYRVLPNIKPMILKESLGSILLLEKFMITPDGIGSSEGKVLRELPGWWRKSKTASTKK
jgi:hypothetical protein